ncbi:hypothetical protein AALP_AA1G143600 [Arabis alpina]|uniref:Uncharacterized protein n=1 Tax=Arabis alpina TaxID=50452 RepID=A0A087HN70_ARAAL|nr:hypothetical protein AALP_AA1G143600 [Arabis alpina]
MSFLSLLLPSPLSLSPKLKPFNGYGKFHCYLVRASSDVSDFHSADWYALIAFLS